MEKQDGNTAENRHSERKATFNENRTGAKRDIKVERKAECQAKAAAQDKGENRESYGAKGKRGKAESITDQGMPKILWLRNIPHRTVKNNLKGERFEDREVQQGDMR